MSKFSYIKLNNFIDENEVLILRSLYDSINTSSNYLTSHKNIRSLDKNIIKKEPLLDNLQKSILKIVESNSGISNIFFDKVWLVKSTSSDTDKTKLPYLPHFDKRRYLKAMVYLHEVTNDHGPIHLGKLDSSINIELRRKKLPDNYKEIGGNTIKLDDLAFKMDPITGNGGDVILFDTNTPHHAGVIKDGLTRNVLRFDFQHPSFNPSQSFFSNIKKMLFR